MSEIVDALKTLRRPKMLTRAAAHALNDYNRSAILRRVLCDQISSDPEATLERLVPIEQEIEARRTSGRAAYSVASHIEVLAAIMAETRSLMTAIEPVQVR